MFTQTTARINDSLDHRNCRFKDKGYENKPNNII